MPRIRTLPGLLLLTFCFASQAAALEFMFEANFAGNVLEGQPLVWNDAEMLLLGRDGKLHTVDPRTAKDARRTAAHFASFAPSELRAQLSQEFGEGMTVTSTGHYLVVHRTGESDAWAQRFETLYRSFRNYFRVRGFQLERPQFPLVAVVFGTSDEYYRHARAQGAELLPNTLGHYDPLSNRVFMYDRVGATDTEWGSTAETIVHEATHQTAYNVGLHSRMAETPQWLVEGLATMFEARGVYRSEASDTRRNRINRGRLDDFRYFIENTSSDSTIIPPLVASDMPFRQNAQRAYAQAWALTFFLTETRPRQYEQYLRVTASRPPLTKYEPVERVRDFQNAFGTDLKLLESNFLQWMQELR